MNPWKYTPTENGFRGYYDTRGPIGFATDDVWITLEERHRYAPDVLANELYGQWRLWWVVPRMNAMSDPTFDFIPGKKVRCPSMRRIALIDA